MSTDKAIVIPISEITEGSNEYSSLLCAFYDYYNTGRRNNSLTGIIETLSNTGQDAKIWFDTLLRNCNNPSSNLVGFLCGTSQGTDTIVSGFLFASINGEEATINAIHASVHESNMNETDIEIRQISVSILGRLLSELCNIGVNRIKFIKQGRHPEENELVEEFGFRIIENGICERIVDDAFKSQLNREPIIK